MNPRSGSGSSLFAYKMRLLNLPVPGVSYGSQKEVLQFRKRLKSLARGQHIDASFCILGFGKIDINMTLNRRIIRVRSDYGLCEYAVMCGRKREIGLSGR